MSHIKRQSAPKEWPIPRKGSKFIVKASSKGIPILVLLRDFLKLARTRKEVKKAIHNKNLAVCGKLVKDEKKNVELLDTITIVSSKKNYKLILSEKGKYDLEEISEKEKNQKIAKIINKKMLKEKKLQLNLSDGRNYLTEHKSKVNDSVVISFEKNKIEKFLPLKESAKVLVFDGKHAGKKGIIKKINEKLKMAEIEFDKNPLNVLIKQLMVIE